MEMHFVEENTCGNCITGDTAADEVKSPSSLDTGDISGDPQVVPRVGDGYQVEIPPLKTQSEYLQLTENHTDMNSSLMVNSAHYSLLGLPIPVMWVHVDDVKKEFCEEADSGLKINGSMEPENIKGNQTNLKNEDSSVKVESLDTSFDNKGGLMGFKPTVVGDKEADLISPQSGNSNLEQKHGSKDYCPVPGSLGNSWSDTEQRGFLLGLYIFGKNLVQVKRFVESKEMGDVLSIYYGKFYRSDGHRRWLECRKIRSRKCIHGQRIFTGWRQQELLSRLLPRVSKEGQNTLVEVSRTFGEGKILLEEYVTMLKATVGLKILIEAVGIGRGKDDLTGIVTEPAKVNQIIPARLEIPVGKACSSLTSGDIIKFLKGDFRLSKARSNDLFWEAVWPRLLARGWHSEQPKNHGHAGSKHALAFLIPGVKKFSRRRLVKGNHYFDSVSDVLNRVALDPRLLEFEGEQDKGNEEQCQGTEKKLDQDGHSGQHHCYLLPKILNSNSELMRFTIVDTSLVHGEEPFTVRKLRSLPIDTENTSTPGSSSGKIDGDNNSDELVGELDSSDTMSNDPGETNISTTSSSPKGMPERVEWPAASVSVMSTSKQEMNIDGPDPTKVQMDNHKKDQCTGPSEKQLGKTIKCQFSRRVKSCPSNYLAPLTKRQRLTACSNAEANCSLNSFSANSGPNKDECHFPSDLPNASKDVSVEAGPSHGKVSTSSSVKENSNDDVDIILGENCIVTAVFPENCQPRARTLFDLNLPHVPLDFETGEPFILQGIGRQDEQSANASSFPSEAKQQPEDSQLSNEVGAEQQPGMATRRQSTRSRPLTTKALEALANGFFTSTKRKRRGMEPMSRENMTRRHSRRARGRTGSAVNCDGIATGTVESSIEDRLGDDYGSNTNMIAKSHVQNERLS